MISYGLLVNHPHFYATYAHMKRNQILEFKNPYFWGGMFLCCLPLILFFGQVPFVEKNSIRAQFLLFQVLTIIFANFHRARQHWGIMKKEKLPSTAFSKHVEFAEQVLILSILFLPYTYLFSRHPLYFSYVQNFPIDFNSKVLAIKILLVIWVVIEIFLLTLAKFKPLYKKVGVVKKTITIVRRSFACICTGWFWYTFCDQSFGVFLFATNALVAVLILGWLVKLYEFKFNPRLIFISNIFLFQVFVTWLSDDSLFAIAHIYITNSCLHSVQYLLFVNQQNTKNPLKKKTLFFSNFICFLLFSVAPWHIVVPETNCTP